MATQEQIEQIAKMIYLSRTVPFFQRMNESLAGIGAVMGYLNEVHRDVTAGEIAAFIGVSSARVAVLLKKMAAKSLIVKDRSDLDARVIIVRLTEHGAQTAQQMKDNTYATIAEVIDQIGMERLLEFFETAKQIALIVPSACNDCGLGKL